MWVTLSRNPNYAVNEQGEIFSHTKQRKLTPKVNHDGYLRIQLWSGGKCEFVSIHRLIAETFLPNPDVKPFVNHKDGNKRNNDVSNLEWCTPRENNLHARRTGLQKSDGDKAVEQIDPVTGETIATFKSEAAAARALGHPNSSAIISHVCHGLCWKGKHYITAFGYKWRFTNDRQE